ncbi:uncharacterized protein LOC120658790 isoform X1 [Panicum virgatum]|uniref:uncharacterized protein LOC120658790 isoform X1 n=1 Tax=Panicum virgatum TaxID=38727 RepID=UPI0019D623E0|nr:uncharacterized protein LOC120658790 isoform X1 [Panicum virgatum]
MHPQLHVATSQDRYARHRDEALAGAFEACRLLELDYSLNVTRIHGGSTMSMPAQLEAWTAQRDRARGILQVCGTRTEYEDSYGSSQASTSVPCGPAWQQPPLYHRQYEGSQQFTRAGPSLYHPMPPPGGYEGASSYPPPPPPETQGWSEDNDAASFEDFTWLFATPAQDNDPSLHTPVALLCHPARDVRPPDRHSYPTYHVHAQHKRGRMVEVVSCWHLFLYCYYGLFRLFGLWLFMIVIVYLSFVSIDIIDVNLLCLWVP